MKIISLMFVAVLLSGCGAFDRIGAGLTGYTTNCVDGVKYLQFPSGVTVKYNQNGTIATCAK
jgi:hypothetical protein